MLVKPTPRNVNLGSDRFAMFNKERDVSVPAIAKRVSSLIQLLKGRYYPVLILVDRETRSQAAKEIEASLADLLEHDYGIKRHIFNMVP